MRAFVRSLVPLAALALMAGLACDGPALPGTPPPTPAPDGGGDPVPSQPERSLYPITQGSTWTYRITEQGLAPYEKVLEVLGAQALPGSPGASAILVRSIQPHLQEDAYLVEHDGFVMRVREEDRKQGNLARTTTWLPATIKSLADSREAGWSGSFTTQETIRFPAGDEEQKERVYVWRVLATESVTVPAGTFEAVKVERVRPDKPDSLRTYWLVPGIGKVKETGERLEELVAHDVRPSAP